MDWTDHINALLAKDAEEALEPEPPEKCPTCGASMYISDRDDDNLCDKCWLETETISREKASLLETKQMKERAEISKRVGEGRPLF